LNLKETYIGLTGRMASGKGEVVRILKKFGFETISLSDIVREEARKTGRDADRSNLQDIGNGLRAKGGAGVLGRMIRKKVFSSPINLWVIDGIRNPAEVIELKKLINFILIGVDSDMEELIKRLVQRGRGTDIATKSDLRNRLEREWGIGEPKEGQQVGKCMQMTDFTINNNKTLEYLESKTREILKEINENE
jgi:dephospho-CoA kinase